MYEEDSKVYKLTRIGSDSISIFDQNDERYYATEWIEKCCANESPLSLTPYTSEDWGDIISIKLMGTNGKFETGNCMTREELRLCLESEQDSDQPSYIQCIYSAPRDKSGSNLKTGLTASPTNRLVFKFPTNGMFITMGSLKRVMTCTDIRNWYALPLFGGKRRRIGNIVGIYGASMNHGQVPGYRVYKLYTKREILWGVEATETYDDYILFLEQELLLPIIYGHPGFGDGTGVRAFVKELVDAVVPLNVQETLEKYDVEYKDPNNFIYKMSKKSTQSVKNEDGTFDLAAVYSLYMQWYYVEEINCTKKGITSIPVYPNLKKLLCTFNNLRKIPSFPSLQKLFCYNSGVEEIGACPALQVLEIQRNKLKKLISFPRLEKLTCSYNDLKELPRLPSLRLLFCEHNRLTHLPEFPMLEMMTCNCNSLLELGSYPKLSLLDCSHNQISSLGDMESLISLECQDNALHSLPLYPKLKRLDCRANPLQSIREYPEMECVSYDRERISAPHLELLPDCYEHV